MAILHASRDTKGHCEGVDVSELASFYLFFSSVLFVLSIYTGIDIPNHHSQSMDDPYHSDTPYAVNGAIQLTFDFSVCHFEVPDNWNDNFS